MAIRFDRYIDRSTRGPIDACVDRPTSINHPINHPINHRSDRSATTRRPTEHRDRGHPTHLARGETSASEAAPKNSQRRCNRAREDDAWAFVWSTWTRGRVGKSAVRRCARERGRETGASATGRAWDLTATTSSTGPPTARRDGGDDEDGGRYGRCGGARGGEDGRAEGCGSVRRAGARCARGGASGRAPAKTPSARRRGERRGRDHARGGGRAVREKSRAGIRDVTAERGDE